MFKNWSSDACASIDCTRLPILDTVIGVQADDDSSMTLYLLGFCHRCNSHFGLLWFRGDLSRGRR